MSKVFKVKKIEILERKNYLLERKLRKDLLIEME